MSTRAVKPGDVLGGKYRVERILGTGGMGIVVAATHIDLGQRVALKFMLKDAMADSSQAERFLREAKAAVQLKSAHTARVLDVGRLKNGEPFMVMEYLDGRDLDAELQARGPLPPHVAVDYIMQTCEALAEAHGLGMVHRDVKLKNLYLTHTVDGRPLVKVLDFGLAKRLGSHGDVSLTATNSVFGSPQYMSPEQMRSAKDVDYRSDIWSIGVCLYELLTGRVPFDAAGVAEICAMVLKDPVVPPSRYAFGLPPDLEAVVLRCLEKDATVRFQSVADLAFALQDYAADEGSARRILTVMQAAQKVEHPTVLTATNVDAGPKTMNAWDSGMPMARRTTQLLSKNQIVGLVGFLMLGVIGISAIVVSVSTRKPAHPVAHVEPSSAASLTEPPPPSPAEPLPTASVAAAATSVATPEPDPAPAPADSAAHLAGKLRPPVRPGGPVTTRPPAPSPSTKASAKPPANRPGSGAEYM